MPSSWIHVLTPIIYIMSALIEWRRPGPLPVREH